MNEMTSQSATIVGLGFVGLTLAVGLAECGLVIHGVEHSELILEKLRSGVPHFVETGLAEKYSHYFQSNQIRLHEKINTTDSATYIVTVGTPLLSGEKRPNIQAIREVVKSISKQLRPGDLVLLRSTVQVGTTRGIVKPILDEANVPYFLAFAPERTIEGRALEELHSLPQIIGGIDSYSVDKACQFFSRLSPKQIQVSSVEAAEMAKLAANTYRDLTFGFANEIALVSERLGVSAHEVIEASNRDYARSNIPLPGPVGGPCLEKDPYILAASLSQADDHFPSVSIAARALHEKLPALAIKRIEGMFPLAKSEKIAILGLAFKGKPETSDLRGSLAITLAAQLTHRHWVKRVVGYDPMIDYLPSDLGYLQLEIDLFDAVSNSTVVILQTNHREFDLLDLAEVAARMKTGGLIYDFWGRLSPVTLPNGVKHISFGRGN